MTATVIVQGTGTFEPLVPVTAGGGSVSDPERAIRRQAKSERLAAAIENTILALIMANVHMNHRHDTLDKAHKNLVETLMEMV